MTNVKFQSPNSRIAWILVILLFFNFLLLGIKYLDTSTDPQAYDTTAYLGEANIIKNNGGVFNFLDLCLTGKYKQANQHPLYILLLTPFASTNISFFVEAKIISYAVGFILLVCLYFVARKMFGDLTAAVAVTGLILNTVFMEWTTMVASESLLILFSFLCMYFVIEGFKKNGYWILAGVSAGLAYLAKGSGLFLIPGFFAGALAVYKLKVFRNKYFYLFPLAFIITASPLFIRNIVLYHDPLFNVNEYIAEYSFNQLYNSKYTVFNPEEGTNQWKFDNVIPSEKKERINLKKGFNLFGSIKKITSGLGSNSKAFLYSFLIFQRFLSGYSVNIVEPFGRMIWGISILLLALFLLGLFREESLGAKVYILSTVIVFVVVLSLVRPLVRYPLPLVPFIWIYIALGIFTVIELANKLIWARLNRNVIKFAPYILIIFLILNLGYTAAKTKMENPLHSVDYSSSRHNLLTWLRANLSDGDTYTMGPNFNWQLKQGIWIVPPQFAREHFNELKTFVQNHKIEYIIIDLNFLKSYEGKSFAKEVEDYFQADPVKGLIPIKNIDGWSLVYKDNNNPAQFLIYKSASIK
jgi:hypothetical protein